MTDKIHIPFNINEKIRLKLNDKGREIHRQHYEAISKRLSIEYTGPEVDADGWSEMQLWEVMELFGPHIHMGCVVPFEATVEFWKKAEIWTDKPDHLTPKIEAALKLPGYWDSYGSRALELVSNRYRKAELCHMTNYLLMEIDRLEGVVARLRAVEEATRKNSNDHFHRANLAEAKLRSMK